METDGLTPSERFVSQLCSNAFLKLWTHPNPVGKKSKELCDCLIVCDPHVIIISVKEIEYKDTGNNVGFQRWTKAAIDKSAKQIFGAERWLNRAKSFVRHDGREVQLPPIEERIIHRLSVSLGSKGQVPISWGDFGNGFVHVCDEVSLGIVFRLMDTISDFTEFLSETEKLTSRDGTLMLTNGGLEDLVSIFLQNGYQYPWDIQESALFIIEGIWEEYSKSEEFAKYLNGIEGSYKWDSLIELYADDLLTDGMFEFPNENITDDQHALIEMAKQPRSTRIQLASAFFEFLGKPELKIAARCAQGYKGSAFVFLIGSSEDRKSRIMELTLRSYVVRAFLPDAVRIVGIATDRPGTSKIGYSSDISYLDVPEVSEAFIEKAREIQAGMGYFKNLSP